MQTTKKTLRKLLILLLIGITLAVAVKLVRKTAPEVFAADACFTVASVYLCFGIGGLIKNLGGLDIVGYSFRQFHRLFRGEKKDESYEKNAGGYYYYRQTRKKSRDVLWMFLLAAAFQLTAILVTLPQT